MAEGNEELFGQLVQTVSDYAIFVLTPEGRIASWNTGAERIKGYLPHEIIGKHFSIFYLPEDIESGKPQRELELAAREGRSLDEGWRLRKNGERFWAHVTITALRDRAGKLTGYGKVTRDMSDLRTSIEALRLSEE